MKALFKQYKPALLFLARFLGVYILGNVLYGIWIVSYDVADPFTVMVTNHSAALLRGLGYDATTMPAFDQAYVGLQMNRTTVVNVFEGCNAMNVSILFLSFLVAYKGNWQRMIIFGIAGLLLIYGFNILRVSGLYLIAWYRPEDLYLMHKFVFTGVLYAFVFVLWFVWVKKYAIK